MEKISKKGLLILNYIPIAAISSAILTPALPNIKEYYQLNFGQLEWIVSIFLMGYMLGQIVFGAWANHINRVFALRAGLIVSLIGLVICYFGYVFPLFWLMLIGRFINALGAASGLVCAFILVNEELKPEEARTVFAYSPVAFSLGVTFAIFFGGLLSHWWGWEFTLFFLFLYSTAMLYLTKYIPDSFNKAAFLKEMANHKDIKVSSENIIKLICFAVVIGATTCFTYCYTTAAPIIAHMHFSYNPSQYGVWNLINVFGVILGGLTVTKAVQAIGAKKVILTGIAILFVALISFFLIAVTDNTAHVWFFFSSCVMYFATSWAFSVGSIFGSNAIANRALGSSILSFINVLCAVVGVIILGYLSFDELIDFVIVCFIALLAAVACVIWLGRKASFEMPSIKKK